MAAALSPDRELEKELLGRYELVAGMDEVGRGALAGPVSVGVAVVSRATSDDIPEGLRDSKLLSAVRRWALVEPCRSWVEASAVGHASPAEVDELGILGALRLAGLRALAQVCEAGFMPSAIILDGRDNWLISGDSLFAAVLSDAEPQLPGPLPPVTMQVKADATCAVVSAASVLAKVERDAMMESLEDPGYGWASNKGYASAAHVEGLARLGASDQHRRSWRLPGVSDTPGAAPQA